MSDPLLKTYPGVDRGIRGKHFVRTGEFRAPRKGEFFLSGAIPEVYVAPTDDITTRYQIMRMVGSKTTLGVTPERMWINQPSTLQPHHALHGTHVLAVYEYADTYRVYFLTGETVSQQMPAPALSIGWPIDR